jgi:hypothetical protein
MRGAAHQALLLALAASVPCGCAASPVVADAHATSPPPREPDGVALDLLPAHVESRTSARASGVVALCPPPSRAEALTVARAYFRAFAGGNAREFVSLVVRDAHRVGEGGPFQLLGSLDRRLGAIDYTHAPVDSMVAYDDARVVPYDAVSRAQRERDLLVPGDVLVLVPMASQQMSGVPLFGANVGLVLRRDGPNARWRIAAVDEDGGPWP